jgi:hypothetical protein
MNQINQVAFTEALMKLYDVPRNSKVRVIENTNVPPGAPPILSQDIISFGHIDGMYSYCNDVYGNVVHLEAWAEVEIVSEDEWISAVKSRKA